MRSLEQILRQQDEHDLCPCCAHMLRQVG